MSYVSWAKITNLTDLLYQEFMIYIQLSQYLRRAALIPFLTDSKWLFNMVGMRSWKIERRPMLDNK